MESNIEWFYLLSPLAILILVLSLVYCLIEGMGMGDFFFRSKQLKQQREQKYQETFTYL